LNQSIIKAVSILNLFVDEKELSLQDVALQANLPKPTAYRLLSTLENLVFSTIEKVHHMTVVMG